jgi:hypothetical protein
MFIQILIIFVVFVILIILINRTFKKTFINVNQEQVKYVLKPQDVNYFKKHAKQLKNVNKLPERGIFYTTTKWNSKSHNYFKYKDKYYIIEPGYYYNILPESEFFINDIDINILIN